MSENGTPNVQIGNVFATNFPNPFFRGEAGISASAARYASGTSSDGSTRYSSEVAYLRLWLPRQGVTAFDFAITSRNTTLTSPATYYAGFRNDQPNTRAFLGAFTVEREAAATYYSKEFAVRQDGVERGLDYRTGPDEFVPSLYLQAFGASQGYTDFFFLHYLRLYYD